MYSRAPELSLKEVTVETTSCRVSLFLAEGIQLQSGKLVMPSCRNDTVGMVRSFAADGTVETEEKLQLASQTVRPSIAVASVRGMRLAFSCSLENAMGGSFVILAGTLPPTCSPTFHLSL